MHTMLIGVLNRCREAQVPKAEKIAPLSLCLAFVFGNVTAACRLLFEPSLNE